MTPVNSSSSSSMNPLSLKEQLRRAREAKAIKDQEKADRKELLELSRQALEDTDEAEREMKEIEDNNAKAARKRADLERRRMALRVVAPVMEPIAPRAEARRPDLVIHRAPLVAHIPPPAPKFHCPLCKKDFTMNKNLKRHIEESDLHKKNRARQDRAGHVEQKEQEHKEHEDLRHGDEDGVGHDIPSLLLSTKAVEHTNAQGKVAMILVKREFDRISVIPENLDILTDIALLSDLPPKIGLVILKTKQVKLVFVSSMNAGTHTSINLVLTDLTAPIVHQRLENMMLTKIATKSDGVWLLEETIAYNYVQNPYMGVRL